MRSYTVKIDKELLAGIHPLSAPPVTQITLSSLSNMAPTDFGMQLPLQISPLLSSSWGLTSTSTWPQLFKYDGGVLIVYSDAIYFYDGSTPSEIVIYSAASPANTYAFVGGASNPWSFVDFGPTWFLVRRGDIVYKLKQGTMYTTQDLKTYGRGGAIAGKACKHMGRLILANLGISFWINSSFGIIADLLSDPNYTLTTSTPFQSYASSEQLGSNAVFWSGIASADALFFIDPDLASNEDGSFENSLLLESFYRNDMGFAVMETPGAIYGVHPLGTSVIVYTADSVYELHFVSAPTSTYEIRKLFDVGCQYTKIAAGERAHYFVDVHGALCRVALSDGRPVVTRLGFTAIMTAVGRMSVVEQGVGDVNEAIPGMPQDVLLLSHNQATFIFDGQRMYSVTTPTRSSAFVAFNGAVRSATTTQPSYTTVSVQTNPFVLSPNGDVTLTQLEVVGKLETLSELQVTILFTTFGKSVVDGVQRYVLTAAYPLSFALTAHQFSILVEVKTNGEQSTDVIDSIRLTYQISDRRFVRSINVD